MSFSSTTNKTQATANGVTTAFTFDKLFYNNTDLRVTTTDLTTGVNTTKTITTDYTVIGAANPAGGTVTFLVAPANLLRVTIERIVPLTQTTIYVLNDNFPSTVTEQNLDKGMFAVQQQQDQINRCLQFPNTEVTNLTNATLPLAAQRANSQLGFDASGIPVIITGADASAIAAAASAAAASSSASSASSSASAASASAASAVAVGNGVLTTKGDSVGFSTLVVRIPVGANDTVLFADSTATPGVAYKTIDLSTTRVTGVLPVAKFTTGTPTGSKFVRDDGVLSVPASGVYTLSFTSSVQTITAAGALTLAHSLGAAPKEVWSVLKCTSTDNNYAVNDELVMPVLQAFSGGACGAAVTYDATNLYVRFGSTAATYQALDKTSGGEVGLDNTKWKVIFKAVA